MNDVLYHDIDSYACNWMEELIHGDELQTGTVVCGDIRKAKPSELEQFRQCHFFAGIGGWPYKSQGGMMTNFGLLNRRTEFWFAVKNQPSPDEIASALLNEYWGLVTEIFAETGSVRTLGTLALEVLQLSKLIKKCKTNAEARLIIDQFRSLERA